MSWLDEFVNERLGEPPSRLLIAYPSGRIGTEAEVRHPERTAILPGSFNPAHCAHRELRAAAQKYLKREVWYEVSARNVDKPTLTGDELYRRLNQFDGDDDIVALTLAPTFVEKARLLPGTVFVVGYDTAGRVLDPKYGDIHEVLSEIRSLGCRFLVAARIWEGRTRTLLELGVPPEFADLFEDLPLYLFPGSEVSSSAIRNGATQ